MKEQKWDDSAVSTKDFIDVSAIMADDDAEERHAVSPCKARVTELRRRIEERMDSKRIESQFAYDLDYDLTDDPADSLQ